MSFAEAMLETLYAGFQNAVYFIPMPLRFLSQYCLPWAAGGLVIAILAYAGTMFKKAFAQRNTAAKK